ncbi:MAG: PQQ-binding-like beta-propeller repeat protein [Acidobacteria bacterium]|nr:PQQ-binding-like beta-propeller repeat protein [Acidobacteriota bacterium]
MDKPSKKEGVLYRTARGVAVVSGIFALILCVLLIANFLQTQSVDPLNSGALTRLMEELRENPEDTALKEQIRALDLLARKAYFTRQWQIRTGSYLLFGFVLALILSLKYMSAFRSRLPDLRKGPGPDRTWEEKLLSRRSLIYTGLGLFVLALSAGALSRSDLRRIGRAEKPTVSADFASAEDMRKNWPAFRGPGGNGVAFSEKIPMEWNGETGENILWKIPVPMEGYNSPIVWDGRLFLSGADRNNQAVFCYNTENGELLWRADLDDIPGSPQERPRTTEDTGYAASTMATDGRRVFVIFATGDAAGLSMDGTRIWAKNLGLPQNHYGHSSSLIVFEDRLLIQYDQNTGGRLIALNTRSGEVIYDRPREVEISWASPILVDTGSRTELILNSNPSVVSYDPVSGTELWSIRCMMGEVAPSPAYADGVVFAVNDYARLVGIDLSGEPSIAWEVIDDLSEVSSPVASGGLVFMAASYGALSCLDAKTGDLLWIEDFDDGFYSSPILSGGNIYLMDMSGVTHIIKAAREFEVTARNPLGEKAVTIPAFMPGRIYIRGYKNLICIGSGGDGQP